MVGHGAENAVFCLNDDEEYPTGGYIREWFKGFSEDIKILVIIDTCYSGSFITYITNSISSKNRIILTSTRDDEKLSWTNFFGYRFFECLQEHKDVLQTFIAASKNIILGEPWLDDNGDKIGRNAKFLKENPPNSEGNEGWLSANMIIR